MTQEEDGGGRTADATVTPVVQSCQSAYVFRVPLQNSGATGFLSVSHLVQMDAGVDGSFGLVASDVGLHSLLTHAHGGKHLSNLLQHGGGEWQ